jgi:sulfhydrogenase subunit gamma (sulfur reductase)
MAETFHTLKVVDAWDETRTLRAIVVEGAALPHQTPGQVVKVKNEKGEGYFALANAPGSGKLELLVRRGGAVGDELIAHAQPGSEVQATAPFGRGFPVGEGKGRDLLLFAAGSGISPMRALVQHISNDRQGFGRVVLFYGERTDHDFAYAKERDLWIGSGVQVVLCASQPTSEWVGPKGYVQDVAKTLAFASVDAGGAAAFLCGMKGMVSAVRDALSAAGLPVDRTYLNY